MDSIAGPQTPMIGNGGSGCEISLSESQARFIVDRGGIMTIYRAASVVG